MSTNYAAQAEIEAAVLHAMSAGYDFEEFVRQAKELWADELRQEARRVEQTRGTE